MKTLIGKNRQKCVWWICTIVALIPIAVVIWVGYLML